MVNELKKSYKGVKSKKNGGRWVTIHSHLLKGKIENTCAMHGQVFKISNLITKNLILWVNVVGAKSDERN